MRFDRYIQHRIAEAEQQEIRDTESLLMGDLKDLLTTDALRKGVHLEVGDDRDLTGHLLEQMGVLSGDHETSDYFDMVSGGTTSGSVSAYFGSSGLEGIIQQHGLLKALEFMQSAEWKLDKHRGWSRIEAYDQVIGSQIMLLRSARQNPNDIVEPGALGVVVRLHSRYEPEMFSGDYQIDSLKECFEYASNQGGAGVVGRVAMLGAMIESHDADIELPNKQYFIRIGSDIDIDRGMFTSGPTNVRAAHGYYDVKNGRIVRNAERSGDEVDY